jgi:Tol biopolymer transport system component
MSLNPGTSLGSYEILASIGAGGMGEVYRARDLKLAREVAIKVLPGGFAQDPERLVRFEREAHFLASLNHPNIGAIYDLAESQGTKFLVLELVPGDTLADLIARGSVSVDEALAICRQISEALEAAHDKGIIHRDLKPANIKITPDGKVKVLDFGLGKLSEHVSSVALSQSPTMLTARASVEGVILGTAVYMSPEQTRGKEIDRRSDIWSFGCVVYELLTGKQAFEGETVTDLFVSILKSEPDWNALPAATPKSVRLLLSRCLQKDPRRRLQHIGEARIAMEDAFVLPEPPGTVIQNEASRPVRRASWVPAVAVLSTIIIAATMILIYSRPVLDIRVVEFVVGPPAGGVFEQAAGILFSAASISPDGRRLAFTARDASGKTVLWVRALNDPTLHPLPGTDGAALPFWSPDSRSLGFFAGGKLLRVDLAGGPPQAIVETTTSRSGTWNRDNLIVIGGINGSLYSVPATGGKPVTITKLAPGQVSHRSPWFLPDGHHYLYFAQGTNEVSGVFVGALGSSESRRLLAADSGAVYSPTGDLLFVRQGTLMRQSFDIQKLEPAGDPVTVAEHVGVNNNIGAFSISENGVLAYKTGDTSEDVKLTWVDRANKFIETLGEPGGYRGVDISRDGKRIAVHRHDGNGGDIWVSESSNGPLSRLTFDPLRDNSSPVFSPDGSHIAFGAVENGKWRIYQKLAIGNSSEQLLMESDLNTAPMSWSPDNKFLVLRVVDPATLGDEVVYSFEDHKTRPLLNGATNELYAQISPNGKWIAYASNESGRAEVYVRPFPSGEGQWQLSYNGGVSPRWRADGQELFFLAGGKMVAMKVNTSGSAFPHEPAQELFESGFTNYAHSGGSFLSWAVSPDGQRFLLPRPAHSVDATGADNVATSPITVIFNWSATIKK